MSGHSKWSTIKRKKEKTDAQKSKIFTKIGREISVAVKEGGADLNVNNKLKELIAKAKSNNVPNDNIERIIKKAIGDGDKNNYETITYEGYGPQGVAIIVETLTDNRNRTSGDLRHYFDKFGGNLGQTGCVSFLFEKKGVFIIENKNFLEEDILNTCLESAAQDVTIEQEYIEIIADFFDYAKVKNHLEQAGYSFLSAHMENIPTTYTAIQGEDAIKKMNLLIEHFEDHDDVQNVWHNWEI